MAVAAGGHLTEASVWDEGRSTLRARGTASTVTPATVRILYLGRVKARDDHRGRDLKANAVISARREKFKYGPYLRGDISFPDLAGLAGC